MLINNLNQFKKNKAMKKEDKSIVYKTDFGKIQVAIHYSEHKKNWYIQGSKFGILETGGSSVASTIKFCIKKFIEDNKLKMIDKITHYNYGIYAVYVS